MTGFVRKRPLPLVDMGDAMKIMQRWLSSQILLMVIVAWVIGLALIHHLWLVPSMKRQMAREESSVSVGWIEQSLSGLARERKALARLGEAWTASLLATPGDGPARSAQGLAAHSADADAGLRGRAAAAGPPTTLPDQAVRDLAPNGLIVCDARRKVLATFGWLTQNHPNRPPRTWNVGDDLTGGPLFPATLQGPPPTGAARSGPGAQPPASRNRLGPLQSPQLTGMVLANSRVCLFARQPVSGGYIFLVRPIDWPMLQDLSNVTGVNVTVTDTPISGGGLDSVNRWSAAPGMLAAEVNLRDSLGKPIGRVRATGNVLVDMNSSTEKIRSAYLVQLLWLIGSSLVTFAVVYLLFIRPLAILVRRLSDKELTSKREGLSSGLFAETGILARKFSDVMDRIVVLSETDPLTGLANRRQFQILLNHEFHLSKRHGSPLAALMIDIDFFKQVNDRYGHLLGDEVLQMVAATVHQVCRKTDVCGRYGGEEFAVVLPRTDMQQAAHIGERVREEIIQRAVRHGVEKVAVTVSVGVAAIPEMPCTRPEDLLDLADKALYRAKGSGRNRTVLASELAPPAAIAAAERPPAWSIPSAQAEVPSAK